MLSNQVDIYKCTALVELHSADDAFVKANLANWLMYKWPYTVLIGQTWINDYCLRFEVMAQRWAPNEKEAVKYVHETFLEEVKAILQSNIELTSWSMQEIRVDQMAKNAIKPELFDRSGPYEAGEGAILPAHYLRTGLE